MRVSRNFRRNFEPLVVTRLNDQHCKMLTLDARELCCLAQAYLSIIPRAAAVRQQLTHSPWLNPLSDWWTRKGEDNVAVYARPTQRGCGWVNPVPKDGGEHLATRAKGIKHP